MNYLTTDLAHCHVEISFTARSKCRRCTVSSEEVETVIIDLYRLSDYVEH